MKVHENPQKSDTSIFFNFHDPGYRKIRKNQTLRFSSTFMTPGTWKFTKIRRFDSIQFSWPRVQENPQKSDASIFFNFHDPGYMKVHKNQTLQFYSIFMTQGTWKLNRGKLKKMYPGSWKMKKIEASDFCGFSCTQGHENWIGSKRLIFVNYIF